MLIWHLLCFYLNINMKMIVVRFLIQLIVFIQLYLLLERHDSAVTFRERFLLNIIIGGCDNQLYIAIMFSSLTIHIIFRIQVCFIQIVIKITAAQ